MGSITAVDERTGRKYTLDEPDDYQPGEQVTFLLNLHGGGSVGMWQHEYFPAYLYKEQYRLVIATAKAGCLSIALTSKGTMSAKSMAPASRRAFS